MAIKIMIDAGHFAKTNRSPVVPAYYESEMNWKLQNFLKAELEKYNGVEVGTTREVQTVDLSVDARGRSSEGYDLMISLHSNACGTESVDRVVGIYQMEETSLPNLAPVSYAMADRLAKVTAEVMQTEGNYKTYNRISDDDRDQDGALDDNYYGILNGARMVGTPCTIIEHSFHTNIRSTNWLLNDNNLQNLAEVEAATIADYYGLAKIVIKPPVEPIPVDPKILYRVQTGAFGVKANADRLAAELKSKGFSTYIVLINGLYKVQVGAFSVKENAQNMLALLQGSGYNAFITTNGAVPAPVVPAEPTPAPVEPTPVEPEPALAPVEESQFIEGVTKVRVNKGAKDYKGQNLSPSVYRKTYDIIQIVNDRVVIGIGSAVTAAIHLSDLTIA